MADGSRFYRGADATIRVGGEEIPLCDFEDPPPITLHNFRMESATLHATATINDERFLDWIEQAHRRICMSFRIPDLWVRPRLKAALLQQELMDAARSRHAHPAKLARAAGIGIRQWARVARLDYLLSPGQMVACWRALGVKASRDRFVAGHLNKLRRWHRPPNFGPIFGGTP